MSYVNVALWPIASATSEDHGYLVGKDGLTFFLLHPELPLIVTILPLAFFHKRLALK